MGRRPVERSEIGVESNRDLTAVGMENREPVFRTTLIECGILEPRVALFQICGRWSRVNKSGSAVIFLGDADRSIAAGW